MDFWLDGVYSVFLILFLEPVLVGQSPLLVISQVSLECSKWILSEYWILCLDYVKETLLLQQCNAEVRVQSFKFSTQKLQEEEASLEVQAKSLKNFSAQSKIL